MDRRSSDKPGPIEFSSGRARRISCSPSMIPMRSARGCLPELAARQGETGRPLIDGLDSLVDPGLDRGVVGQLARLDMAPGREPEAELGVAMEEDLSLVDYEDRYGKMPLDRDRRGRLSYIVVREGHPGAMPLR